MSEGEIDHGALCMACGLCCSGAIFDHGKLDPGEEDLPERTGIRRHAPGYPAFGIPCGKLAGMACSIYADRPGTCRRYACEVLHRLDDRAIGETEARSAVASAHELIARIEAGNSGSIGSVRAEAARNPQGWRDGDPQGLTARAERNLALLALERHLDRHFRKPHQKQVMEG